MRLDNRCLLAVSVCIAITGCADNAIVKETQFLMGTAVEISVADSSTDRAAKLNAIARAFDRIRELDALMSFFNKESEVSRINDFADVRPIQVSPDTIKVIKRADELNKITEGAFDITVAPLVELWGFGRRGAVSKIPSDEEVREALKIVGMDKLKIDYARKMISFKSSGTKIDLGGIATGYAVDCAMGVLRESGIKNAMINAGGDIFCMGGPSWNRAWKIGIQHPRIKSELLGSIYLKDRAIATSGDYEKFFFWKEKRISHIIDPRTGMPVAGTPASVTIIAPDCITADAFSTAIFVLGPDAGLRVLNEMKPIEGMIVNNDGKDIKVYKTDGFEKLR